MCFGTSPLNYLQMDMKMGWDTIHMGIISWNGWPITRQVTPSLKSDAIFEGKSRLKHAVENKTFLKFILMNKHDQ